MCPCYGTSNQTSLSSAEGFYYDVDLGDEVVSDEAIAKIEKEMKKICKDGKRIVRREISKEEALEMFNEIKKKS